MSRLPMQPYPPLEFELVDDEEVEIWTLYNIYLRATQGSSEHAQQLAAYACAQRRAGKSFHPILVKWLTECLARMGDGYTADIAFGYKAPPHKHKTASKKTVTHRRAYLIVEDLLNKDWKQTAAIARAAEMLGISESVARDAYHKHGEKFRNEARERRKRPSIFRRFEEGRPKINKAVYERWLDGEFS